MLTVDADDRGSKKRENAMVRPDAWSGLRTISITINSENNFVVTEYTFFFWYFVRAFDDVYIFVIEIKRKITWNRNELGILMDYPFAIPLSSRLLISVWRQHLQWCDNNNEPFRTVWHRCTSMRQSFNVCVCVLFHLSVRLSVCVCLSVRVLL